jgi:hypothetical protein
MNAPMPIRRVIRSLRMRCALPFGCQSVWFIMFWREAAVFKISISVSGYHRMASFGELPQC